MVFTGSCNADVFNTWLERLLLPRLEKGTTVVMDNASFHKSMKTKEIFKFFQINILFLPTYSPELNPIEHVWHQIKSRLKAALAKSEKSFIDTVLDTVRTI